MPLQIPELVSPHSFVFDSYTIKSGDKEKLIAYWENILSMKKTNDVNGLELYSNGAARSFVEVAADNQTAFSNLAGIGILLRYTNRKQIKEKKARDAYVENLLRKSSVAKPIKDSSLDIPGVQVGGKKFYFVIDEELKPGEILQGSSGKSQKKDNLGLYHHHAAIFTNLNDLSKLIDFFKQGLGLRFTNSYTLASPWLCTRAFEGSAKDNNYLRLNTINQTRLSLLLDFVLRQINWNNNDHRFAGINSIFESIGWNKSLEQLRMSQQNDLYTHSAKGVAKSAVLEEVIRRTCALSIQQQSSGILLPQNKTNIRDYIGFERRNNGSTLEQVFFPTSFLGLQELAHEKPGGKSKTERAKFTKGGGENATAVIGNSLGL